MKIGNKLQSLRKANELSQEELAEKLGVSRQSVSLWENDQTYPAMENMFALCEIYNIPLSEIVDHSPSDLNKDTTFKPISLEGVITFGEVLKTQSQYSICILIYICLYGIINSLRYGAVFGVIFAASITIVTTAVLLFFKCKYSDGKVKKTIIFYKDFFERVITYANKIKKTACNYTETTLIVHQGEYYIYAPKIKILIGKSELLTADVTKHLEYIKTKCRPSLISSRQNYSAICILLTICSFASLLTMTIAVTSSRELWLALLLITVPLINLFFVIKSKNKINRVLRIITIVFAATFLFLTLIGLLVTQLS